MPLRALARGLTAGAALALAACATPAASPPHAAATPPAAAPLDPSYDWHVLEIAKFGSLLKEFPLKLHEVLLFRDDARDVPADEGECYAVDGSAPRFMARTPDEYTLCFKQDRLVRVHATVMLPVDQAAKEFAAACGLWLENAGAPPTAAAASGTVSSSTPRPVCEGRDGIANFSARLEAGEPSDADVPLSIKLDAADTP